MESGLCYCGRAAVIVTSWKDDNAGLRFISCARYPKDGYCKYFRWLDLPMCDRAKQIIPSLLRKVNKLESENRNLETHIDKLEEMARILQSFNCILEKENQSLKSKTKSMRGTEQ
ncbi:hypothetical protein ACS0TY_021152 [Phlomoides rotata]